MKIVVFSLMYFYLIHSSISQVSVYDCNAFNPQVGQAEVESSGLDFERSCIEFTDGNYDFNVPIEKNVIAQNYISFTDGFHAHQMDSASFMHFKIREVPLYDVAVLNYTDLNSVLRYKKVEFGVELQGELLNRINEFISPGSTGSTQPINPFIEWEFDINIKFTHIATGIVKWADAFYFQDFDRDTIANDWSPVENDYPMRFRFAPSENGLWNVQVGIKYDGLSIDLPDFNFNVIESGHPGFVKVHNNNRNFQRGNKLIFPVGHNMAGPDGADIGINDGNYTHKASKVDDWLDYHADIARYIDEGGKYIKLIQQPYTSLIEFEKRGDYSNRMHYAWEQDSILELCEKEDVIIQFNMMFQNPLMRFGQYGSWPWDFGYYVENDPNVIDSLLIWWDASNYLGPYCYYTYSGKEPYEMFLDSVDMRFHEQRNRYYIARYGYSPQIYNFELLSEPWWLNTTWKSDGSGANEQNFPFYHESHPLHNEVRNALYNYNERISGFIKDSLKHRDHLIGISVYNEGWQDNPSKFDISAYIPNIDIIGVNVYSNGPNKLITTKDSDNNSVGGEENSYYEKYVAPIISQQNLQKPLIYSECGHDGVNACSNYIGHYIDVMTLGFTGVAGFFMWDGFRHDIDGFDQRELWESTIRAEKHMDGHDVTNVLNVWSGLWKQGRQTEKQYNSHELRSKEIQYYIAEDNNSVVGYVLNNTFNYHTKATSIDCHIPAYDSVVIYGENAVVTPVVPLNNLTNIKWNHGNNVLYVEGLANKMCYRIDWYDYKQGNYLSTQFQKTDNQNRMKLKFPELIVENYIEKPIVWFTMKVDYNCNENKMNDEYEVDEIIPSSIFEVYPNPFENEFFIETTQYEVFEICSTVGEVLVELRLEEGRNSVNLSKFKSGVYLLVSKLTGASLKLVKI